MEATLSTTGPIAQVMSFHIAAAEHAAQFLNPSTQNMTSKTVMEERSSAQHTVDRFFETRQFPTQLYCDDHARRITGASTVREVDIPGSLSYTVLCTDSSDERSDMIVSFRQPESALDQTVIELARFIHGDLVPEATFHGKLPGSNPPLLVYTMACLSGSPCLQLFDTETELRPKEEARYMCFVKHLAR